VVTEAPFPLDARRVSTLELFFDLVFVFTVTQLTTTLSHHPDITGLVRVGLMLVVIWWMYGGYAWLTNAVALDGRGRRALLLLGMAGFLVLALSIPHAFAAHGDGVAFGLAYLVIAVIHASLFTRASGRGARGILRIAPFNLASALLVLLGGVLGGGAQYVGWALAGLLEWCTPFLVPPHAFFEIEPTHFVERHGLVVIVAIGESVVAIGIGASGHPVDLALAGVAGLGLALTACLWWAYFGGDDEQAEAALGRDAERRPLLALRAFGVWHLPLLLGVVGMAFGLKQAFGHAFSPADFAPALGLAAGAATFFLGDVGFRRSLRIGGGPWRSGAALLALATLPLGHLIAPVAQIAALVVVLGGALALERRAASTRRDTESLVHAAPT
jgi:low temperature requirement protein LtrA